MDNLRCGRQCDFINRPAYIVLFKGDDSDFQGNQSVDIVIDTELDTTGMKAHFRFMDFVQDFDSIPENKTLSLVFPNAKTSEFPLGAADATLKFEDSSGKFRTISNRIHIVVTNSVHEAYNNEDSQSITVTVKGTVTWDMIEGKPTIPEPVTIDPALSQTSENPVQNKAVTKALYTGFTEWEFSDGEAHTIAGPILSSNDEWYFLLDNEYYSTNGFASESDASAALSLSFGEASVTATRHLITPTKTSQLTNDGPSSGPNVGHPFATTNQIPDPVDISGKLDGSAAYPAWVNGEDYQPPAVVSHKGRLWSCQNYTMSEPGEEPLSDWLEVTLQDLKQDALSDAQTDAVNSGATAAKVETWDGYAAQIAAKANASDVNAALAQKASLTDLPYRFVEPGKWEFSDGQVHTITGPAASIGGYNYYADSLYASQEFETEADALDALMLNFTEFTATRASLSGHLLDRAGNLVVVSGDTTLTLPAAVPGYIRDFLVRLEISGSTVPTITFSPDGNESVTYETDGDEFPVPDEAGDWLYSFTESCVAHKFAVSLKKVNEVAAPQAHGGA